MDISDINIGSEQAISNGLTSLSSVSIKSWRYLQANPLSLSSSSLQVFFFFFSLEENNKTGARPVDGKPLNLTALDWQAPVTEQQKGNVQFLNPNKHHSHVGDQKKRRVFFPPRRPLQGLLLFTLKKSNRWPRGDGATEEQTRTESDARRATRELFLQRVTSRSSLSFPSRRHFAVVSFCVREARFFFGSKIRAKRPSEAERELGVLSLSYLILGWTRLLF